MEFFNLSLASLWRLSSRLKFWRTIGHQESNVPVAMRFPGIVISHHKRPYIPTDLSPTSNYLIFVILYGPLNVEVAPLGD